MAASIDQQFIEYIVKSVVNNPDKVKIERRIDEKGVLLELSVDPEDLGRVIGKRGATAQSLRTLLRALGTKNDARYNLKIVDTGDGSSRPPRPAKDEPVDEPVDAADDLPAETSAKAGPVADEPAADTAKTEEEEAEDEDLEKIEVKSKDASDVVSRTRAELAELDDLDV